MELLVQIVQVPKSLLLTEDHVDVKKDHTSQIQLPALELVHHAIMEPIVIQPARILNG